MKTANVNVDLGHHATKLKVALVLMGYANAGIIQLAKLQIHSKPVRPIQEITHTQDYNEQPMRFAN